MPSSAGGALSSEEHPADVRTVTTMRSLTNRFKDDSPCLPDVFIWRTGKIHQARAKSAKDAEVRCPVRRLGALGGLGAKSFATICSRANLSVLRALRDS